MKRLRWPASWWCSVMLTGLAGCQPATTPSAVKPTASVIPAEESVMKQQPEGAADRQAALVSADPAALLAEIKAMVGTAAATEPAQCKKVGLGHKPCGGPSSYLIYSTAGLDEARLLEKVSLYNQLDQAQQQRLGLVSDCAVVPEPAVALVGGVCVANGNGDVY